MKKILGISLVWILLSGSIVAPIGFLTAFGVGGGQTINQISASTTISLSSNTAASATFGQSVTFTATVSPSTATGNVEFNDTSTIPPTTLGTATLSSGQATFTTSSLTIGTHSIVAKYLGDTNNAVSTSSQLIQTVNQASTSTVLSSNTASTTLGQSVTFTATVSPSTATGNVQFNDTTTIPPTTLGTATLSSGHASILTSSLSIGSHNIVAKYLGDTNNAVSTSAPLTQVVNQISTSTTTTLSSSQNPSTLGQSVTFTATVSPSTATGNVQFNDTTTIPPTTLGTATLSSGHASILTSSLSIGSHNIVAKYLGDTNNAVSTSAPLTQVVNQISTSATASLSSSATSIIFGQSITFTATVSPSTATGNVQLLVNGANFGPQVTLSGGQATFTTSSLPAGTYGITASYSGDANFNPSISNSLPITTTITIGSQGSTPVSATGNDDDDDDEDVDHETSDNDGAEHEDSHGSSENQVSQENNNPAASGGTGGDNSEHDNVKNVDHKDKQKHHSEND